MTLTEHQRSRSILAFSGLGRYISGKQSQFSPPLPKTKQKIPFPYALMQI